MSNNAPNTALRLGKGLIIALCLFIATMTVLQWIDLATFETLFYLRAPLITALLLLTFPLIAFYAAPSILANLFVLQNKWRLTVVTVAASITGLGIMLILDTLSMNAPCRLQLANCTHPADTQKIWPYIWGIVLALPVIFASIAASEINYAKKKFGIIAGFTITASLMLLMYFYAMRQGSFGPLAIVAENALTGFIKAVLFDEARAGFIHPETGKLTAGHLAIMNFSIVIGVIYIIGFFFFRPSLNPKKRQAPALFYLLILILVMTFVFGLLTFFFDFYHIPVIITCVAISFIAYRISAVDHFYVLHNRPEDLPEVSDLDALNQRLNNQGDERTLVVVCTTGGGIQAAGWTTKVLTGLHQFLGEDFSRAIGCISSVSGGSVGTMHYLDRFNSDGVPDSNELYDIVHCATKDSLDATGWGFAYPDLWRIIGLPFLAPTLLDRGSALETDWKSVMKNPDAKLSDWQAGVAKGCLPITLFNATQVESGRRFLLTPVTLGHSHLLQDIDFNAIYPQFDVDVTTAARLSATFSYVSPICKNNQGEKAIHIADGGYFDNYGVFTAAEWLDTHVLPNHADLKLKRVIIIEIHAFAAQDTEPTHPQAKPSGWLMAVLGPLLTLAKVRTSTQDARNTYDLAALASRWDDSIKLEHFTLAFPQDIAFFETRVPKTGQGVIDAMAGKLLEHKNYQPPLSWKLSIKQKQAIEHGWNTLLHDGPDSDLRQLKALWDKRNEGVTITPTA